MDPRSPTHAALGLAIRELRKQRGLSQKALAGACGLDRGYVSGIERGVRNPSLMNIVKIASALGTPAATLLTTREHNTRAGAMLTELQDWYSRHCDGDWEHRYGITIATLDNPGWDVRIDLRNTPLADRPFERVEVHHSDKNWLVCWVEEHRFESACGPHNLTQALSVFLRWAD